MDPSQLKDALPADLQYALTRGYSDIPYFAEYLLGIPLHDGQRTFLTKDRYKINVLSPANRWGKSITIAIKHIHATFYKIGIGRGNTNGWLGLEYRTANIAPQSAMTEPVFKAMLQILTSTFPIPQSDGPVKNNDCLIGWHLIPERTLNTPPYKLVFINNSYTEFRTLGADKGDSLQGRPYGYISYDEGGRSDHLQTEIDENILPRLFDWSGELDIVSTPDMNSPSLIYHYELFQEGMDPDNKRVYAQEGSITDNTFFSPEQIAEHMAAYEGLPSAPQVLHGRFVFAGDLLFPLEEIQACLDPELDTERYVEGKSYIIGTDTAMGSDEQVHQVLDVTGDGTEESPFRLVNTKAHKGMSKSLDVAIDDFANLFDHYNQGFSCRHLLETWNGESAQFYRQLPRHIQRKTKTFGSWQPDGVKAVPNVRNPRNVRKADLLLCLRNLLAKKALRLPAGDKELFYQLSIYREQDDKLRTDRLMALALACYQATMGKAKNPSLEYVEVYW